MVNKVYIVPLVLALVGAVGLQVVYGTNESSYKYEYQSGSLTYLYGNMEMGTACTIHQTNNAVTNATACQDGFFNGWKNWCSNHAVV